MLLSYGGANVAIDRLPEGALNSGNAFSSKSKSVNDESRQRLVVVLGAQGCRWNHGSAGCFPVKRLLALIGVSGVESRELDDS